MQILGIVFLELAALGSLVWLWLCYDHEIAAWERKTVRRIRKKLRRKNAQIRPQMTAEEIVRVVNSL